MKKLILIFSLLCLSQSCKAQGNKQVDSVKAIFNPEGYYFPIDSLSNGGLTLGKHKFEYLGILPFDSIIQKYDKGFDNIDKKSKKKLWCIYLHFFDDFVINSSEYEISRDTVKILFKGKKLGKITIEGRFLTAKGPIDDETVEETKTVVFKCILTDNNKPPSNVNFVYTKGD